jgi:hypothetical protein
VNSILIFGCGNMGGAMLAGWLRGGMDPARFTVVDPFLAAVPQGVTLLREVPATRFDAGCWGSSRRCWTMPRPRWHSWSAEKP